MAVTAFSKGYRMTAVNDSLNQATVGNFNFPANGRFRVRVNSIQFMGGVGVTETVLRADGATGPIIYDGVPASSETTQIIFSEPQDIDDLTVTTYPAGLTAIIVHCT